MKSVFSKEVMNIQNYDQQSQDLVKFLKVLKCFVDCEVNEKYFLCLWNCSKVYMCSLRADPGTNEYIFGTGDCVRALTSNIVKSSKGTLVV